MITTSHAVISALVGRNRLVRKHANKPNRGALVVGGFAPDVGLWLLSLGAIIYYPLFDGLSISEAHQRAMDDLYFNSVWWIAGHNLLHAPINLVSLIAGAAVLTSPWKQRVRFFAAGALLHSMIDVLVHHDDGPLVFFPVSWSIRFSSPVSYWDPDHYGWVMRPIDLAITMAGVVWTVWRWRTRRPDHQNMTVSD